MKVLFCIDSLRKGGAERVITNIANALIKEEIDISILTIQKGKIEYDLNSKINIDYLEEKNNKENNNLFSKFIVFNKRSRLMENKIKSINPDIIVSFLPYTSFLVLKAVKGKIPVIVSVRNDPNTEYSSFFYKFYMKKLYPKANAMVYQTKDAQEYFKDILKNDSTIIYNALNPDFLVSNEFQGERKKVIVSVGRLYDQKNQELLIKSFIEIQEKIPDYNLIIYGEGYNREKLEKIINDNHMNKRILLPGNIKNVKDKIYDASLFVLSSDYEGMPNALIEAMCLGLPVISTDCPCGGPKTFIKNGENGLLINVGNKEELKEAILKIIYDKVLAKTFSKNAIKISKILDPKIVNQQWKNYIIKTYEKNK